MVIDILFCKLTFLRLVDKLNFVAKWNTVQQTIVKTEFDLT